MTINNMYDYAENKAPKYDL